MSEELKNMELTCENLEAAAGGISKSEIMVNYGYRTEVYDGGYLALRSVPQWGYDYEIGALFNGSFVVAKSAPQGDYVYVEVRSAVTKPGYGKTTKLDGMCGWVNWNFLKHYTP